VQGGPINGPATADVIQPLATCPAAHAVRIIDGDAVADDGSRSSSRLRSRTRKTGIIVLQRNQASGFCVIRSVSGDAEQRRAC
jgi:hypothetical protein